MTKSEFHTIFEKMYNSLCNYANSILKDFDQAEDVVQDIFVTFWNKRNDNNIDKSKIENYLVRSIKFKCIDIQRKEIVQRKHQEETLHITSNIVNEDIKETIDYKTILYKTIEQLPKKTKEVFILSKINGHSYQEIADKLEISAKTVENQMGRAFKHIREILKNDKMYLHLLFLILLTLSRG